MIEKEWIASWMYHLWWTATTKKAIVISENIQEMQLKVDVFNDTLFEWIYNWIIIFYNNNGNGNDKLMTLASK